jgi:phage regulator Rha-like protein
MTTNTKQRAAGAMNSNGLHTHTNAANFDSHGSLNQAVDGKAIAMTDDFALTTTSTEARVDTRLLARQMGNKHKPVIALIDKYLSRFKAHGQVLFKKADGDRKQGGGMAERYALLNEDQAYFLLSLSRNNDTVVTLKSKLIKAFGNARRAADLRKTEYLPGYHELHDTMHVLANGSPNERWVHANVNKAVNGFAGIVPGQRASAALPQQALLIVGQLVAAKAAQGATDHHEGYQRIKTNLTALQGVIALEMQP